MVHARVSEDLPASAADVFALVHDYDRRLEWDTLLREAYVEGDAAPAKGIVTVSVDAYVTDPNTWNLYNNQVKYAELGAEWLFKQMGESGTVWYTRGLAGHPADSDRDIGFNNMLKKYPNITVINPGGTFTGWNPATATQITNDFIAGGGYDQIDGIWASGMGTQIIDAIKETIEVASMSRMNWLASAG